jgi:NDP-sugar pyrophosphorylase family protein
VDANAFRYFSRYRAQVDAMDLGARSSLGVRPSQGGVRALLLVGGRPGNERFGEIPFALLDVLGRNTLLRTIDRLRSAGVREIAVLSDTEPLPPRPAVELCKFNVAEPENFWDEALRQVRRLARQSECVLVLRLGCWAEVDYAAMVGQHRRTGSALTQACSAVSGPLEVFIVASSGLSEAAALLRGELRDERVESVLYNTIGYINPLSEPAEMRKLVLDSFAGKTAIRPHGEELRPGVWVGRGARIHRDARLLAPAFIGAFCNVHRGAVVTRGSVLEHHAELDCAAVLDNSSLLPYTRVAAGLDVEQALVGFHQVHSLQHQITVDVEDTQLIGSTQNYISMRAHRAIHWLLAFLPNVLWKLIFESGSQEAKSASEKLGLPTPTLDDTSLAPVESQTKSYREMVAARRYGDE